MDTFNFNPVDGFANTTSYPNPQNETEVRTQLNSLHLQTQTFINNTMKPLIEETVTNEVKGVTSSDASIVVEKTDGVYNLKVSSEGSQGCTVATAKELDAQTLASAKKYAEEYNDYLVTGTLATGETSITISDTKITTSSALDFYTSIFGVSPKTVTVSDGSVTLTFKAQTSDMIVGVKVNGTI